MLLKNEWNNQEIKGELKKKIHGDKWKWKHNGLKPLGSTKSSSKRKVYSNTGLPQEARTISNKQPNLTPKGTRKRTKTQNQ